MAQPSPSHVPSATTGERTLGAMIITVKGLKEATEIAAVPGLKGAAGVALLLLETIRSVKSNKSNCLLLAEQVTDLIQVICEATPDKIGELPPDLAQAISEITNNLVDIEGFVRKLCQRRRAIRFFQHSVDAEQIADCRLRVAHAYDMFLVRMQTHMQAVQQQALVLQKQGLNMQEQARDSHQPTEFL